MSKALASVDISYEPHLKIKPEIIKDFYYTDGMDDRSIAGEKHSSIYAMENYGC